MIKTILDPDEVLIRDGIFELSKTTADKPHLLGSRCYSCGEIVFPVLEICPQCDTEKEMEKITLSPGGKLYSYSVVVQSTPDFKTPYAVGIVELIPEGILILSHIVGDLGNDFEKLKIGMELGLTLVPISTNSEGKRVISYAFEPAK
jgi:uncharacterized OB-fold protein